MKRIYFFVFMIAWMFAACSSNTGTVKTDASAENHPTEIKTAAPSQDTAPQKDVNAAPDWEGKQTAASTDTQPAESKGEMFRHSGAGFSLVKPKSWKYMSPEMAMAAKQSVEYDDKELEKMVRENPNSPLVMITRYQEPYPTLNPSVSVNIIALPVDNIKPKEFMNVMLTEGVKKAYPDMTYVDEIQDAEVDGINSAYSKFKFTQSAGGQKFPVMARMWLVPRGKFMFIVGMSGPQEGPDVSEETFTQILNSIKIDK